MDEVKGVSAPAGETMDAGEAARVLSQSREQAARRLDFRSPWLTAIAAMIVLVGFGIVWWSVRGQSPYRGPTPLALIGLYAVVLVRVITVVVAHSRAQSGVSGRSVRRRNGEAVGVIAGLVGVYAVMGALAVSGASDGVVYGVYIPTATLLVLGVFWAGRSAVREEWVDLGVAVALILVAAGSAFSGPVGVWLWDGVGCCIILLALAAAQTWRHREHRKAA